MKFYSVYKHFYGTDHTKIGERTGCNHGVAYTKDEAVKLGKRFVKEIMENCTTPDNPKYNDYLRMFCEEKRITEIDGTFDSGGYQGIVTNIFWFDTNFNLISEV